MIKDPVGRAQSPRVLTGGASGANGSSCFRIPQPQAPTQLGLSAGQVTSVPHFKKTRLLEMRIRQQR